MMNDAVKEKIIEIVRKAFPDVMDITFYGEITEDDRPVVRRYILTDSEGREEREEYLIYAILENGAIREVRPDRFRITNHGLKEKKEANGESVKQFLRRTGFRPVAWIQVAKYQVLTNWSIQTSSKIDICLERR